MNCVLIRACTDPEGGWGQGVPGLQIRVRNWKLFFLFLNQNICCGYSKEPSRWDDSFEHPKHMFNLIDKKIIAILHKLFLLNWPYGVRSPLPLKNHKNIGFLSIICPDLLKSQSYQASIQCWGIIGTPAKHHLKCVSLEGQWWPAHSNIWILPPLIN